MSALRTTISIMLLLFTSSVLADLSLDQAKAKGLVGEDASGYLAAVSDSPDRDTIRLIDSVNDKRYEEYERIAASNKIALNVVEQLAGKKAIEKTRPGHYIRLPGGSWQKK